MSTQTPPPVLQNPDLAAAYQEAFDALGRAYWEASDIPNKDLIHGTQEAIGDIITAFDEEDLAHNTALFLELTPKMKAINDALKKVEDSITSITRNIDTAASVVAAVSQVLTLLPL